MGNEFSNEIDCTLFLAGCLLFHSSLKLHFYVGFPQLLTPYNTCDLINWFYSKMLETALGLFAKRYSMHRFVEVTLIGIPALKRGLNPDLAAFKFMIYQNTFQ